MLVAVVPKTLEWPPLLGTISMDLRVVGFAVAASVLTGLIFGAAPCWQVRSLGLSESLKQGGREPRLGLRGNRMNRLLVVTEVAIAVLLTIGGTLMLKSFWRLQSIDSGIRADNVLTMRMVLRGEQYRTREAYRGFFRDSLDRIESLPGVRSAAIINYLPIDYTIRLEFSVEGRDNPPGDPPSATYHLVSESYLDAMGIRLLSGRNFTEHDNQDSLPVAIINRKLAQRYWPGDDPTGKRLRPGSNLETPWYTVVGVVDDVRHQGLGAETSPELYTYYLQNGWDAPKAFVVRTEGNPVSLARAVQREIWAIDDSQPIFNVRPMAQIVDESVWQSRLTTEVVALFGAVALILAALGVYGVVSYSVSMREHEFGVRMALGAQKESILKLVVGEGVRLGIIGALIGVAGAFALTHLLESLLYQVSATDPVVFIGVPSALAGVTVLASYLPARRATRVDPMTALRCE